MEPLNSPPARESSPSLGASSLSRNDMKEMLDKLRSELHNDIYRELHKETSRILEAIAPLKKEEPTSEDASSCAATAETHDDTEQIHKKQKTEDAAQPQVIVVEDATPE